MEFKDPVLVAFNDMINTMRPTQVASRVFVRVFEGTPIALLGFSVIIGAIIVALLWYWGVVWAALGRQAWDLQHVPKGWTLLDEIYRDKYGNDQMKAKRLAPDLFEIRRPRWSGIAHAIAIIVAVIIIILGVYVAFQVCGIPPSILVGLGVVGLGISWGLQGLVMEIVAAIQIHLGNEAREGDNIHYWGANVYGKIKFMGATRVVLEFVNKHGDMVVHNITYQQLLRSGFSRFVSGGEKYVYQYDPDKTGAPMSPIEKGTHSPPKPVGYNLLGDFGPMKKRR